MAPGVLIIIVGAISPCEEFFFSCANLTLSYRKYSIIVQLNKKDGRGNSKT